LQEKQRSEKAARLAAASPGKQNKTKGNNQTSPNPVLSAQGSFTDVRLSLPAATRGTPADMRADDSKRRTRSEKVSGLVRTRAKKPVALLSHLMQYEKLNYLTLDSKFTDVIHPAILSLGLQFSEFKIAGGNARCAAMLLTFIQVIKDYVTPPGMSLQRHLTQHISKQVEFLNSTRSLATSMKRAIKDLKRAISVISIDDDEKAAKDSIYEFIENFIHLQICSSDLV
jgi:translation initiation factor eIF-2B subunit delta